MKRNVTIFIILLTILLITIVSGLVMSSFFLQPNNRQEDLSNPPGSSDNSENPDSSDSTDDTENPDSSDPGSEVNNPDPSDSANGTDDPDSSDPDNENDSDSPDETDPSSEISYPLVLAFAGDVNLDENSKPVAHYDREQKGIEAALSPELIKEMQDAHIMMLNNEFAYSTRGTKTPDKSYNFRAKPERVNILKEMGVDIVSLANNHALDYGIDALLDTFTTLDEAEIDYVGAGADLERAKKAIYYTLGDKTIAYLAASRVIFAVDWYATDTRPGMIGTYDPALLLKEIKIAKENSDFVVVYVHWGIERTHEPVEYQVKMARQYIDAGADVVIGCHPHVLQGIEFYKGKPIAYSLGNYWFNNSNRETTLLKLYLEADNSFKVQLLPAMQKNTHTYLLTSPEEKKNFYKFMEDISFDVTFDEDGYAIPK